MTRREICCEWLEGRLTDEEARKLMKDTKHPVRRNVDSLNEADSWWDGEEDNTQGALLGLYAKYGDKVDECIEKIWPDEKIIKYDPDGNEL